MAKGVPLTIGDKFTHEIYGEYEVVYDNGSRDSGIKFKNTGYVARGLQRGNINRGHVKDVFCPAIEGVGYIGCDDGVDQKSFKIWQNMFTRSYSPNYHKTRPTYIGCSVAEEWHNYSNFKPWFDENYVEGHALDKDLRVKGNKVYSKDTCCFIPLSLNNLLTYDRGSRNGMVTGVSKRSNTKTGEFNGRYQMQACGANLYRTTDLSVANETVEEFREFAIQEKAAILHQRGEISERIRDYVFAWVKQ